MENRDQKARFSAFYYIFKIVISLAGVFFGIVIALTLFYPMILAFSNSFLVAFVELYLIILFGICFGDIFNSCFFNYVNYKPLFFNIKFSSFVDKKKLLFSFYIFGLLIFFFFITSWF